jgi:hypothetical protein
MMCPVSFASIPGQPDRPKPCLHAIVPMSVLRLQIGLSREAGPGPLGRLAPGAGQFSS